MEDIGEDRPVVAVAERGKAVSIGSSVRMTGAAHEAGVETHPDLQGRGHATKTVAGWARAVREMGRISLVQHVLEEPGLAGGCTAVGVVRGDGACGVTGSGGAPGVRRIP